jgi:hypothetical protein
MFRSLSTKGLTVRGRLALLAGVAVSAMLAIPAANVAAGHPIDAIALAVPGAGALAVVLLALATAPCCHRSRASRTP